MARKMMVYRPDGTTSLLTETSAGNEADLQETMKRSPDLLPVDEFGMTGPLLVVGRETTLKSGYVDLACLARGGELLIIEFKTGPQNPDFRHALAQLLDYGSDLWGLSYDEFESTVAARYFANEHCKDSQFKGQTSIDAAARTLWPDLTDEEAALLRERLTAQLASGAFHYLVVAQRFTPVMERTVEYLNATMVGARFYAVELVRFIADGLSAFETRTIHKPASQTPAIKQAAALGEAQFLEKFAADGYRRVAQDFLTFCSGLGLRVEAGATGRSIRVPTPDRPEPLSIAWLFPPGVAGWYGLTDLTLGFDPSSAEKTPSVTGFLEQYLGRVQALPNATMAKSKGLQAYRLSPEAMTRNLQQIREVLAELVKQVSEVA